MEALKTAEFTGKRESKLPTGATVVEKTVRLRVEEIENGFILCKNSDITYEDIQGERHYMYIEKKWFSKENPMSINIEDEEVEESLADKLG